MLSYILQVFRNTTMPLCTETIAQILDKEPEVVGAMLQELSVMGWIQVAHDEGACKTCRMKSSCGLSISSPPAYKLVPKTDGSMADPHKSFGNHSGGRST